MYTADKKKIRRLLRKKQDGKCCYCLTPVIEAQQPTKKKKPAPNSETLEHLIRKVDGGKDNPDNWALSCYRCNVERGGMDWLSYTTYRRGEMV